MFRGLSMFSLLALAALTLSPTGSRAASKEIMELQRDIAALQDQLKQIQQSQDRQLAEIRTLVQQSVSASIDAGKAVAVIQSGFQQNLKEQETKVVGPVVALGNRMDQMSGDMRTMQQGLADLLSQFARMQTQLTDLQNAVKVMQAPPAPPPAATTASGASGNASASSASSSDTPTMSATELYNNAMRDRQSGKLDLALQEFGDYLRWYGNTPLAPNAQFYIASIHAAQDDYENAVREYDLVLEKYPDNNKTPDALYGKGTALVKMGRRTDGSKEFQELIKRFPNHTLASQSCTQLTSLGLRCPGSTASVPKRTTTNAKK